MQQAEIYLDLSSASINGDSQAKGYEKQVELWDWAWGMTLGEAGTDTGDKTQQAQGSGVTISKPVDSATTAMLKYLEDGKIISTANMVMVQRTDFSLEVKMAFKNMVLSSYELKVDSGDKEVDLTETWTFHYDEVTISYKGRPKVNAQGVRQPAGAAKTFMLKNEVGSTPEAASLEEKPISEKPNVDMGAIAKSKEVAELVKKEVAAQMAAFAKNNKTGR